MSDQFVSLHGHSKTGSLLDALISVDELFDRAKSLGQTATALTDHGSVFSIYDAYKASKRTGVKLISGNEFYFRHSLDDDTEKGNKHLVLLAYSAEGWANILRLNYIGWGQQRTIFMKQYPIITFADLEANKCQGIICLTACSSGVISRHIMNNDMEKAHRDVERLKKIFGANLFLEVQPHNLKTDNGKVDQAKVNQNMFDLCREHDIKPVATCDAHYLDKKDSEHHDLLLAIKDHVPLSDPHRHKYGVSDFYLKPGSAIIDFFGVERGIELIKNSKMIADRCENPTYLEPPKDPRLPVFPVQDAADYGEFNTWREQNIKTVIPEDAAYLRYKTSVGFAKMYEHLDPEEVDDYYQRIKKEIKLMEDKNFPSYMLIVADYIDWAKKNGNHVAPGRGSVVGSLVANLLGITSVNPMKHNLIFERFLNKFKTALPDIDTDFAYPEKVKDYVKNKYGYKRVASISNVSVMTPKVVVKDVARSLELGGSIDNSPEENKSIAFKIANDITKSMPDTDTIEEAMMISPEFKSFMLKYPQLMASCKRLQNTEKSYPTHAAGIVIVNEDLDSIAPLRKDKDGNLVMSWEKERCEENGYVKLDFLGLKTLCFIGETLAAIKMTMEDIPLDDSAVFDDISNGDVRCVFQLEITAAPMCKAVKPKSIDDLAVITSLIRPAVPVEQRNAYISKRAGKEKIELLHPSLYETTKNTYGELLFEEQLMTLGRDVAGWDLDKADSLRKITKLKEKGKELTEKTKKEFIIDAVKNNVDEASAKKIWERVEHFTGYGFSIIHSTAYSYLSYYTAWLKHHYPTEFLCAVINAEDPNSDKLQEYKQIAKDMGIKIAPPNINTSGLNHEVIADKQLSTGLLAIKGIGEDAINHIIENRPYKSFPEFIMKSIGTKGNRSPITKTVIESLAKVGCFDELGITRKNSLEHWADIKIKVVAAMKKAIKNEKTVELNSILDGLDINAEYTKKEILQNEMAVIGHYLTGSHNDMYGGFFTDAQDITNISTINGVSGGQTIKIEAVIKLKIKELKIKKKGRNFGKSFAKYLLEDIRGKTAELTLWPDHYERFRNILKDGTPIRALCEVNEYMDTKSLVLRQIQDIPDIMINGKII